MKARPKACAQCNKTFWTKFDHNIKCPRCEGRSLKRRIAHVLRQPLPEQK